MMKSPGLSSCLILILFLLAACEEHGSSSDAPDGLAAEYTSRAYIGTASGEDSVGIYCIELDLDSGKLRALHNFEGIRSPGYLAVHPSGKYLFAVHRIPDQKEGGISAFAIEESSGKLLLLNRQSTMGRGACYVSVDNSGNWAMVANYSSGSVASFSIGKSGELGEASSVVQHEGSGPNAERQQGPHAHYIEQGVGGYVYAADLGTDKINLYGLNLSSGELSAGSTSYLSVEPGRGPRHVDFHPNGKYVYVMNELIGSVSVFSFSEADNSFESLQMISSLPRGFDGYNKSADIHVHPNGRFLYASNRGDSNSIATFVIDPRVGLIDLQRSSKPKESPGPETFL